MRKIIFSAVCFMVLVCCASAHAGITADKGYGFENYEGAVGEGTRDTVKSDVEQTMANARAAYDEMGKVTYEKTIPKPEDIQTAASSCLDGILSADFGFGLSLPSISDLFNNACKSINSGIKNHLDAVDLELSTQFSHIGAGWGEGAPSNRINYDQVGDSIADNLWKDISGGF